MPYDPSLPANGSPLNSAEMRGQLQGLKTLIDANTTVNAAQVDGVTTLPPGSAAQVLTMVNGGVIHFTFQLPQGAEGTQGQTGNDGPQGPQGPPFGNAVVDSVTPLPPGSPATVSVSFDGVNVHFTFGLPQGVDGAMGPQGPQGEQGPPGEVTNAALAAAIAGTSNNSNGVSTLDMPFVNDPPTLADMELMRAKVNELILALRR